MAELELNGAKKAAILVLALGVDIAPLVMKFLSESEIQRISNYMSHLGEVGAEEVEMVLQEFHDFSNALDAMVLGGEDYVRKVLLKTLTPERANWIISNLTVPSMETGLEALKWLDPPTIARFLSGEHPQTIAAIMAHLDPVQAGSVMTVLSPEQQTDVISRVAKLERIPPGVIRDLDRVLQTEIKATGALETDQVGGVKAVAEILNNVDQASEREIMGYLDEADAELAEEIRRLMFTFEDLGGLDDRGMQAILREVDNAELTLALKSVSDGLREKILRNMSQRAADMLREELEVMGPVRVSDVEQAQQKITQVAKRLEEEGKIMLVGKGDDSFV